MFQAGHSVAAPVAERPVLIDAYGAAGGIGPVEIPEDAVDPQGQGISRADHVLSHGGARRSEREESGEKQPEVSVHREARWMDGGREYSLLGAFAAAGAPASIRYENCRRDFGNGSDGTRCRLENRPPLLQPSVAAWTGLTPLRDRGRQPAQSPR